MDYELDKALAWGIPGLKSHFCVNPHAPLKNGMSLYFMQEDRNGKPIYITGRDFDVYPSRARSAVFNGESIVEVGAGLGGLLTLPMLPSSGRIKPNMIIDTFNYTEAEIFLELALNGKLKGFPQTHMDKVSEFKRRLKVIKDPDRILLINSTLEQAILDESWLKGKADMVVDLMGACVYQAAQNLANKPRPEFLARIEEESLKIVQRERVFLNERGISVYDSRAISDTVKDMAD
jgi:hypothetical protein